MHVNRCQSNDSVSSLIRYVQQLSEKCGIPLDQFSTQKKISKTKKVYEHHQIQQLNNDPIFVELVNCIKENISVECVLTECVRKNYNLLSSMGILEIDSTSLAFDPAVFENDENYADYNNFTIEQLKDVINHLKQELVESTNESELAEKRKNIFKNHTYQLSQDIIIIDQANDQLNVNDNTNESLIDNEGFSEFKSNLENYRSEVLNNFVAILDPIKSAVKNIMSTPSSEVTFLKGLQEDGLLNSTLNNDESAIQNFGGILKTYAHTNHQSFKMVNLLLKNFIPNLLGKYNIHGDRFMTSFNGDDSNKIQLDPFNISKNMSIGDGLNDNYYFLEQEKDRDDLIKALLCCLDTSKPIDSSQPNDISEEAQSNKLWSYLRDYSRIYAELKYNTLVNQAEEIGYLELVSLIGAQNLTYWKTQITKLGNKSTQTVEKIRNELHSYLLFNIKPYIEEKIKIWDIRKTGIIADLMERDFQSLALFINYLKEAYLNFNKQLDNYTTLLVQKEDMLKSCANCVDRILFMLNNRVLKSVSLDDANVLCAQHSTENDENNDSEKWKILENLIYYLATLYRLDIKNNDSINDQTQLIKTLIDLIEKDAKSYELLENEEYSQLIENVTKLMDVIKPNMMKTVGKSINQGKISGLETILPEDILLELDKCTSVFVEIEKKFNDLLSEISTKKKMIISDQKIQSKRSELLRFCLEC